MGNAFPLPRAERERHGLDIAAKAGCPDPRTAAACLRAQPAAELLKWSDDGLGSGPTLGGGILPANPEQAFTTGHFNQVPVIQGTTRDEHHLFTAAIEAATDHRTTQTDHRQQIQALFTPTGDPNGHGTPPWPRFATSPHVQSLQPGKTEPADLAQEHKCTFWKTIDS